MAIERTLTFTIADIRALGDRLWARGNSKLVEENNVKGDLRTAARLIWRLATEYENRPLDHHVGEEARNTITIPADE